MDENTQWGENVSDPKGYDKTYTAQVFNFFHQDPKSIWEVRIIPREDDGKVRIHGRWEYVGIVSGYYDDFQKAALDIKEYDGEANIYFSLNPVNADLLARASNRLRKKAKRTTKDDEIILLKWAPIDIDVVRFQGISSTDDELGKAIGVQAEICAWLQKLNIPFYKGESGNGVHILIPLVGYENNEKNRKKLERFVKFMHTKFSSDEIDIDETVFNPGRVWKTYGTMACKGDHTEKRPHRRSYFHIPDNLLDPVDLFTVMKTIIPTDRELKEKKIDKPQTSHTTGKALSDIEIIERACVRDEVFRSLWGGSIAGYRSQSEADYVLLKKLAFWCQKDKTLMERLFDQSGLCRDKWREREDYRMMSLDKAADSCTKVYDSEFYRKDTKKKKEDKLFSYFLAQKMLSKYIFKTTKDNETIYCYDKGIYRDNGEVFVKEEINKEYGDSVTTNMMRETLAHIRWSTYIERERFNYDTNLVNLKNGVLDIRTMELKPHGPEYFFTMQLPLVYDPDGVCPKIEKFFAEVLYKDDVGIIEEMFGYSLYREYFIQKAIMLTGEGANGKSTLINLYINFLGKENCSSVPLQNLEKERFATASLYGKLTNVCSDLPDCALKQSAIFKGLVGGDPIQGEQKYKQPFTFVNFAKLIFAANKIPETRDKSTAFFRRWVIVNFPNKFEGGKAVPQPKLLGDLTSESELSGLLNFALKGLKRLFDNHQFSDGKSIEDIMDYYEKASNPVFAFLDDRCILEKDGFTSGEEIYCEFAKYCNSKHIMVISVRGFNSGLRKQGFELTRPKKEGARVRGWSGIRLRREDENNDEGDDDNKTGKGGFF